MARLIVLLAAIAGIAATLRLGVWQLDRGAQKESLQRTLEQRRALPPLDAGALAVPDAAGAAAVHQRTVVAAGRWVTGHDVYLENRQMNGVPGFYVVSPLLLADGSAVAVQRGWLPRDPADRTHAQAPALPPGPVRVAGRIAPPPGRLYDLGAAASGAIRQNLDLDGYAAELRLRLRPLSVVQDDGPLTPPDGLRRQWPQPGAGVERHDGYAFQWFALAALIAALYVWFQLIRPRRG